MILSTTQSPTATTLLEMKSKLNALTQPLFVNSVFVVQISYQIATAFKPRLVRNMSILQEVFLIQSTKIKYR
jgi:hypothetical protein